MAAVTEFLNVYLIYLSAALKLACIHCWHCCLIGIIISVDTVWTFDQRLFVVRVIDINLCCLTADRQTVLSHVDTLYKIVYISPFSTSLHALMLIFQVMDIRCVTPIYHIHSVSSSSLVTDENLSSQMELIYPCLVVSFTGFMHARWCGDTTAAGLVKSLFSARCGVEEIELSLVTCLSCVDKNYIYISRLCHDASPSVCDGSALVHYG